MNEHEKDFFNIMQSVFGENNTYASPIYDDTRNKEEFCDICVKKNDNIIIFQLYKMDENRYIENKNGEKHSSKKRWHEKLLGSFNEKKQQIEKNIKYIEENKIFYDRNNNNPINKDISNYHYFIVLDGWTQYQKQIYIEKNNKEDCGGVAFMLNVDLNNPTIQLSNDDIEKLSYLEGSTVVQQIIKDKKIDAIDDEFYINIENCIIKQKNYLHDKKSFFETNRIIHVIDKESWQYTYVNKENINIFNTFFDKKDNYIIDYLIKKEQYLIDLYRQNKKIIIADERSLISCYKLNNNAFPKDSQVIIDLFWQQHKKLCEKNIKYMLKLASEQTVKIECPELEKDMIFSDAIEGFKNSIYIKDLICILPCFEDFFMCNTYDNLIILAKNIKISHM